MSNTRYNRCGFCGELHFSTTCHRCGTTRVDSRELIVEIEHHLFVADESTMTWGEYMCSECGCPPGCGVHTDGITGEA